MRDRRFPSEFIYAFPFIFLDVLSGKKNHDLSCHDTNGGPPLFRYDGGSGYPSSIGLGGISRHDQLCFSEYL